MLLLSIGIIIFSVLLDQFTKHMAVVHLKPIGVHPFLPGVLELRYDTNEGIAWGMLQGKWWLFVPISLAAVAAILFMLIRYRKELPPTVSIALAMIAGGGIGNQIDRIVNQSVVDFLNFQFIDFPIFNVADCFVTVGCALALFDLLIFHRDFFLDEPKPKKAAKTVSAADHPCHEEESASAQEKDETDNGNTGTVPEVNGDVSS